MKKIKINNKTYEYPENWQELTFRKFVQLYFLQSSLDKINDSMLIAILLDIGHKELQEWDDIESYIELLKNLTEFTEIPDFSQDKPKEIHFRDKVYQTDGKVERFPVYLFEDMKVVMLKDMDKVDHLWPKIFAMWLLWKMDDYDLDKTNDIIDEVKELPAHQVIGLSNFFLTRLLSSLTGKKKGWLQRLKRLIRK